MILTHSLPWWSYSIRLCRLFMIKDAVLNLNFSHSTQFVLFTFTSVTMQPMWQPNLQKALDIFCLFFSLISSFFCQEKEGWNANLFYITNSTRYFPLLYTKKVKVSNNVKYSIAIWYTHFDTSVQKRSCTSEVFESVNWLQREVKLQAT